MAKDQGGRKTPNTSGLPERLRRAIETGGSVLHAGRLITRAEDLPTPEQLLAHEEQQKSGALAVLDQRIAELMRERERLAAAQSADQPPAHKPEPPSSPSAQPATEDGKPAGARQPKAEG